MGHRARGALGAALLSSMVAAAATVALKWAAPGPSDALALLLDIDSWSDDPAGAQAGVVALVSLVAEVCVAWIYLGALLTAAGALPGGLGRLAAATARRLVPAALRRLLEVALGVGVATSSLAAGAALPAAAAPIAAAAAGPVHTGPAPTAPSPAAAPSLGSWPQLDWPGLVEAASSPAPGPTGPSGAPASPEVGRVRPVLTPVPQVPAPIVAPAPVRDEATRVAGSPTGSTTPGPPSSAGAAQRLLGAPTREPAAATPVVVRRGDTLWAIAARHLGPRATPAAIATAWPRWYAANRTVIGADPDLLLPGQRLTPPPG